MIERMDEEELKNILAEECRHALGQDGDKLSTDRRLLLSYFNGDPLGNEIEGRSQVISRPVLESVIWALPQLLRVFAMGDVFQFEPVSPGDEAAAEQATIMTNWVMHEDNPGFMILYTWILDCLIQRNGFVKVYWDESRTSSYADYTGLSQDEFDQLTQADDVEVISDRTYPNPDPTLSWYNQDAPQVPPTALQNGRMNGQAGPMPQAAAATPLTPQAAAVPVLHDVKLRIWKTEGRVKIVNLPPEEVLLSAHAPSTVLDGKHFCAHRSVKTASDLIEMGFDPNQVEEAVTASATSFEFNSERINRFQSEENFFGTNDRSDSAMRSVLVTEAYLPVDWDNDGVAELRCITFAGEDPSIILSNEVCDEVPIISIAAIPLSHKAIGLGLADLVMDIQQVKTALSRGILDNIYYSNVPRMLVDEASMTETTIDDLLRTAPGSIIRCVNSQGIQPLSVQFTAGQSIPLMEMLDQVQEIRTGISRQGQGLDPAALNKTATGVNLMMNASSARIELIARCIAEQGIKVLAKRILGLLVRHQQEARVIRITGHWVPMDVRNWKENMDVSVQVGLGAGNKDQMLNHLMNILQIQQQVIQTQGGVQGPLVNAQGVYEVLNKLTQNAGFRDQNFFLDPRTQPPTPPQQQQQSPEMMLAQATIAVNNMKAQSDMKLAEVKLQHELALEQQKAQHEQEIAMTKLRNDLMIEQQREKSKADLAILAENMKSQRLQQQHSLEQQTDIAKSFNGLQE